mgnify:CR=1 FL=1
MPVALHLQDSGRWWAQQQQAHAGALADMCACMDFSQQRSSVLAGLAICCQQHQRSTHLCLQSFLLFAECCLVLCELPDLLLQINYCTLLLCRHEGSVVGKLP